MSTIGGSSGSAALQQQPAVLVNVDNDDSDIECIDLLPGAPVPSSLPPVVDDSFSRFLQTQEPIRINELEYGGGAFPNGLRPQFSAASFAHAVSVPMAAAVRQTAQYHQQQLPFQAHQQQLPFQAHQQQLPFQVHQQFQPVNLHQPLSEQFSHSPGVTNRAPSGSYGYSPRNVYQLPSNEHSDIFQLHPSNYVNGNIASVIGGLPHPHGERFYRNDASNCVRPWGRTHVALDPLQPPFMRQQPSTGLIGVDFNNSTVDVKPSLTHSLIVSSSAAARDEKPVPALEFIDEPVQKAQTELLELSFDEDDNVINIAKHRQSSHSSSYRRSSVGPSHRRSPTKDNATIISQSSAVGSAEFISSACYTSSQRAVSLDRQRSLVAATATPSVVQRIIQHSSVEINTLEATDNRLATLSRDGGDGCLLSVSMPTAQNVKATISRKNMKSITSETVLNAPSISSFSRSTQPSEGKTAGVTTSFTRAAADVITLDGDDCDDFNHPPTPSNATADANRRRYEEGIDDDVQPIVSRRISFKYKDSPAKYSSFQPTMPPTIQTQSTTTYPTHRPSSNSGELITSSSLVVPFRNRSAGLTISAIPSTSIAPLLTTATNKSMRNDDDCVIVDDDVNRDSAYLSSTNNDSFIAEMSSAGSGDHHDKFGTAVDDLLNTADIRSNDLRPAAINDDLHIDVIDVTPPRRKRGRPKKSERKCPSSRTVATGRCLIIPSAARVRSKTKSGRESILAEESAEMRGTSSKQRDISGSNTEEQIRSNNTANSDDESISNIEMVGTSFESKQRGGTVVLKGRKCPKCKKSYSTNQYLNQHFRAVHERVAMKCSGCEASFFTWSDRLRHRKTCPGLKNSAVKGVKRKYDIRMGNRCPECNRQFASALLIQEHYYTKHLKIMLHQCKRCGQEFGYARHLQLHVKRCGGRQRNEAFAKTTISSEKSKERNGSTIDLDEPIIISESESAADDDVDTAASAKTADEAGLPWEWTCRVCRRLFSAEVSLHRHIVSVHDWHSADTPLDTRKRIVDDATTDLEAMEVWLFAEKRAVVSVAKCDAMYRRMQRCAESNAKTGTFSNNPNSGSKMLKRKFSEAHNVERKKFENDNQPITKKAKVETVTAIDGPSSSSNYHTAVTNTDSHSHSIRSEPAQSMRPESDRKAADGTVSMPNDNQIRSSAAVVSSDGIRSFVCFYCPDEFDTFVKRIAHMKEKHTDEYQAYRRFLDDSAVLCSDKRVHCVFCSKHYRDRGHCFDHIREYHRHLQNDPEIAAVCRRKDLLPEADSSQSVRCQLCSRTFSRQGELTKHMQLKHNASRKKAKRALAAGVAATDCGTYVCFFCPDAFVSSPRRMVHMKTNHRDQYQVHERFINENTVIGPDERFHCAFCSNSFTEKRHCNHHVRKHHHEFINDPEKADAGRRRKHDEATDSRKSASTAVVATDFRGRYACFFCPDTFTWSPQQRMAHMKANHHDQYQVLESFMDENTVIGPDKRFHCAFCSNSFTEKRHCNHHVRKHHQEFINDPEKAAAGRRRKEISAEADAASTSQSWRCQLCPMVYFRQGDLTKHMNTKHNDDMDRSTGTTPVEATTSADPSPSRTRPKSTATRDRCQFCHASIKFGRNLQDHIRRMHKEAVSGFVATDGLTPTAVRCHLCPRAFVKDVYLNYHLTQYHRAESVPVAMHLSADNASVSPVESGSSAVELSLPPAPTFIRNNDSNDKNEQVVKDDDEHNSESSSNSSDSSGSSDSDSDEEESRPNPTSNNDHVVRETNLSDESDTDEDDVKSREKENQRNQQKVLPSNVEEKSSALDSAHPADKQEKSPPIAVEIRQQTDTSPKLDSSMNNSDSIESSALDELDLSSDDDDEDALPVHIRPDNMSGNGDYPEKNSSEHATCHERTGDKPADTIKVLDRRSCGETFAVEEIPNTKTIEKKAAAGRQVDSEVKVTDVGEPLNQPTSTDASEKPRYSGDEKPSGLKVSEKSELVDTCGVTTADDTSHQDSHDNSRNHATNTDNRSDEEVGCSHTGEKPGLDEKRNGMKGRSVPSIFDP